MKRHLVTSILRTWALATAVLLAACSGGLPGLASTDERAQPSGEWSRLPDPPLSGRTGAVVVAVDDRLVVAGGWNFLCPATADCALPASAPHVDGAAYDFATGEWAPIADAPIGFRIASSAVIGDDLYILSRCELSPSCPAAETMLRYRADTDMWKTFPAPTRRGLHRLAVVAGQVIAFSESDERAEVPDLRFDPDNAQWEALPDDPLPALYDRSAVGLNGRLQVFGSIVGASSTRTKLGAEYDFQTEEWTELAPSQTQGLQVWRGGSSLYLNPHFGKARGGVYDRATNSWSPLPEPPESSSWRGDMAGLISAESATYESPEGWVLDSRTSAWIEVGPRPEAATVFDVQVGSVGLRLAVFGGQIWNGDAGQLVNHTWMWTPTQVPGR